MIRRTTDKVPPNAEVWKNIDEYEDIYQISNLCRIKSLSRYVNKGKYGNILINEKILKSYLRGKNDYLCVCLYKNKKGKLKNIHRLLAEAFLPNPFNKPYINHIDGNKQNNLLINIEWCTAKENCIHASLHNLVSRNYGEKSGHNKLTESNVKLIRTCGKSISRKKLAEMFGVNIKHIDRIRSGERWIKYTA